ncbi:hypothetical protein ES703_09104 [subsurface metagenome]
MGIETIGTGIKTRLQTISALRKVYAPNELRDSINSFPSAIIMPAPTDYDQSFDGLFKTLWRIIVLISKQDTPSALNKLIDYMEPTGTNSIKAAIYGDCTLNGTADDCELQRNLGFGFMAFGGINYLSTEFELIVYARQ